MPEKERQKFDGTSSRRKPPQPARDVRTAERQGILAIHDKTNKSHGVEVRPMSEACKIPPSGRCQSEPQPAL